MSRLPRSVRPVPPGPGQESVWDYPRPPALERSDRLVQVRLGSAVVAESTSAWRVMETSHPPTWYLPRADVAEQHLRRSAASSSVCEWKGAATYWDLLADDGRVLEAVGWSYESPTPRFVPIAGHLSFMPGSGERASIDRAPAREERNERCAQRTRRINDGSGERASIDRAPAREERNERFAQRTRRINEGLDCFIDGERVLPQAGGFYGGWITADVVGPFKGEPGSWGW